MPRCNMSLVTCQTLWMPRCNMSLVTCQTLGMLRCNMSLVTCQTLWMLRCNMSLVTCQTLWMLRCNMSLVTSYPSRPIAKTKLPGRVLKGSNNMCGPSPIVETTRRTWKEASPTCAQRSANANAESMKEKSRASKAVEVSFSKIHICQLFIPIEFNDQWVNS